MLDLETFKRDAEHMVSFEAKTVGVASTYASMDRKLTLAVPADDDTFGMRDIPAGTRLRVYVVAVQDDEAPVRIGKPAQ